MKILIVVVIICQEVVVSQGYKCVTVDVTVAGWIPTFPSSDNDVNRGTEFCHSTSNASRIWRKVGNESVLMGTDFLCTMFLVSLSLSFYVRDTARLVANVMIKCSIPIRGIKY